LADPAVRSVRPIRPQVALNTAIAAIAGLLLTLAIAFGIEYLDDAVKTPEIVEHATGLHTLGAVALAGSATLRSRETKSSERLLVDAGANSQIGESFRILRTNIEFAQVDRACRTLLVTSPNPGEG